MSFNILPTNHTSLSKLEVWNCDKHAVRRIGLVSVAIIFLFMAAVLTSLSFLPPTALFFSGAYFILGGFLTFIALGVLTINLFLDSCLFSSLVLR
ncbi:hypothetical protein [Chlamydiifrater phoenicopteri]|uniref:hypothetical protein n=1 Tax=Chlamydiifrater phoenicopteri TaxID=2681469 RepID=UPI001FE45B11|nr:hypothetical protein [Chlamydiifrater phoenicopteri]